MRVLACVLALIALTAAGSAGAKPSAACPHSSGAISYSRAGVRHVVALATCANRAAGEAKTTLTVGLRSRQGRLATVSKHTILVDGKPVLTVHGGPAGLDMWSPDGRFLFYVVYPGASSSLAADGLVLRALDVASRKSVAFGSLDCAPDGNSVVVQSQRDSTNAYFFATRWQLWRVALDGSHRLLDAPPAGFADESPAWSPDGHSLLFVREHNGYGSLEVLQNGRVFGPLAHLGYRLGYYGHHNWDVAWRA